MAIPFGKTPSFRKQKSLQESDKFLLTSKSISICHEGYYPFEEAAFLIPHEMLRREMIKIEKAMKNFDPIAMPWKTMCIFTYYTEFFYPCVHEHHDTEENIFFPHYKALGAQFPDRMAKSHVYLIAKMDTLREVLSTMVNTNSEADLRELKDTLITEFGSFLSEMKAHLAEEEAIWPPIILHYGEVELAKVEDKIKQTVLSNPAEVVKLGLCAVIQAMGVFVNGQEDGDMKGWASKEFADHFLASLPWVARVLLLPTWDRKYNKYKKMLTSCTGDVDLNLCEAESASCSFDCLVS